MQQTISPKYYQWLLNALDEWQDGHLISQSQAEKIAAYYQVQNSTKFISMLIALLASVLIGGGSILLVAHNWQDFSQTARAVVSFCPLLVSQMILWWANSRGVLVRESAGIIHVLFVGASLALVSQTFHYAADLPAFIRAWLLLVLPVSIVSRSESLSIAALLLGIWFIGAEDLESVSNLVIALAVPIALWHVTWKEKRIVSRWFYMANITFLIVKMIDVWHFLPDWSIFPLLASLYYISGVIFQPTDNYWRNPLRFLGSASIFFVSIGFCFLYGELFFLNEFLLPNMPVIVLLMGAVFVVALKKQLMMWQQVLYASIPLAFLLLDYIFSRGVSALAHNVVFWGMNIFIILVGMTMSIQARSQGRVGKMNIALILVMAVVFARFFDADDSFLTRGILFVLAGCVLFVFNYYYVKRVKKQVLSEMGVGA